MKDGIIIQARTGSTRLHNKILLPFYGEQRIIDILISNIKQTCPDKTIVFATTNRPQDDVLAEVARQAGILCYRGDEDNVLDRFIRAAEAFGIDRFIRVCSDNPFLRPDSFRVFFKEHDACPADYIAYGFADGRPTIKSHLGLFAELTTTDALRRAAAATQEKLYIEHVTIYLYTHPEEFKVRLLPLPDELEGRFDLRFTLDTMEDFTLLQELYATFYEKTDRSVHALLQLVEAHPEYREKMLENIARNEK
nr:aminotransferase [uncultured Bacteroides sp.]